MTKITGKQLQVTKPRLETPGIWSVAKKLPDALMLMAQFKSRVNCGPLLTGGVIFRGRTGSINQQSSQALQLAAESKINQCVQRQLKIEKTWGQNEVFSEAVNIPLKPGLILHRDTVNDMMQDQENGFRSFLPQRAPRRYL